MLWLVIFEVLRGPKCAQVDDQVDLTFYISVLYKCNILLIKDAHLEQINRKWIVTDMLIHACNLDTYHSIHLSILLNQLSFGGKSTVKRGKVNETFVLAHDQKSLQV